MLSLSTIEQVVTWHSKNFHDSTSKNAALRTVNEGGKRTLEDCGIKVIKKEEENRPTTPSLCSINSSQQDQAIKKVSLAIKTSRVFKYTS